MSATDTTWLYSANFGSGACSPQGWTTVDLTAPAAGDYWHVDDYAGLSFGPIAGSKSLWCGARSTTACSFQTFPGYGNSWNQRW